MKRLHIVGSPDATLAEAEQLMDFGRQALGNAGQVSVSFCRVDQVAYFISNSESHMIDSANDTDLADYDLVWFRGKLAAVASEVATIANYLKIQGVQSTNTFYSQRRGVGKVNQMYILAANKLPIPKTLSAANEYLPQYINKFLVYPVIVKDTHGSHGHQNYLVHNEQQLSEILRANPDIRFMVQEFIKSEGDYRILFAGDSKLIIHRLAAGDSHLNNTSQGAKASLIAGSDFPEQVVQEARRLADICEYEIAGVDVIIDSQTGHHYFLEINSQPQVATGAFVAEKQRLVGEYFSSLLAD